MNPDWTEGKLEFDLSGATRPVERPDKLAQPLKSVDFIANYPRQLWLIEVKDPDGAPPAYQPLSIKSVLSELSNDALLKEHILPKLYGTFIYLIETQREPRGRVRYAVLIGLSTLTAADRHMLTDKIQRVIDRIGPKIRHSRLWPIAEVHNVNSWNTTHPTMQITRLP